MTTYPLIRLDLVDVVFGGNIRALTDISLTLAKGEILGLVGESGSGKTTLCRVISGLTRASIGTVKMGGVPVQDQLAANPLAFRRRIQMLLQDAVASLSPRMTIGELLEEPIAIHKLPVRDARTRLSAIIQRLGLSPDVMGKFPHQISGGQARRVGVARALIMQPEVLLADELTAGLDMSVQGELLNLLLNVQKEFGLTYLFVSHNLNVIRRVTTRTAVMYLGQIVEEAPTPDLFDKPAHPYTVALLSTNPALDPARRKERIILRGEIPGVVNPPSGCRFHTRCPVAQKRCSVDVPQLVQIAEMRTVRCHFPFSLEQSRTVLR